MKFTIAIDGPAAAGKSTVAKGVAKILGYTYIDTGAMYRCVTLFSLQHGVDPKDESEVVKLLNQIEIELKPDGTILLNGEDVTLAIRSTEVAQNVSYIASYKEVRLHLVKQQRKLASKSSVVMDGRDIGTYVLPNADIKIFQVATVKTRAIRRYEENLEKGIECGLDSIEEDIKRRDYIDSHRDFAPLKKAEDAHEIDTSYMSIEEAIQSVLDVIKQNQKIR